MRRWLIDMSTILHRICGDEYTDAVAFVADIQVLSHHSSRYSVINIQVLCAHLPWYSVLIFLGTPCSSCLVLCAHLPWYSVLLFLDTVRIFLGTLCSSSCSLYMVGPFFIYDLPVIYIWLARSLKSIIKQIISSIQLNFVISLVF